MTDTIKPALSKEEWMDMEFHSGYGFQDSRFHIDHKGRVFVSGELNGQRESVIVNDSDSAETVLPKIAALALYKQPFGFTREDVRVLRDPHQGNCSMWWLSDYPGAQMCNCGDDRKLSNLADRIAALLPPEE